MCGEGWLDVFTSSSVLVDLLCVGPTSSSLKAFVSFGDMISVSDQGWVNKRSS